MNISILVALCLVCDAGVSFAYPATTVTDKPKSLPHASAGQPGSPLQQLIIEKVLDEILQQGSDHLPLKKTSLVQQLSQYDDLLTRRTNEKMQPDDMAKKQRRYGGYGGYGYGGYRRYAG